MARLLVVGVGTGLELELLPADLRVTGIDISAAMLDVARERVARKGLRQVKGLHVMERRRDGLCRRPVRRRRGALCDERRP